MGFQSAVNQTLGTAEAVTSEAVSEVEAKKKEQAKLQRKKTSDFKNFDKAFASKSVKMLNNEIQGKKQQRERINARVEVVKKRKSVLRDTGPVVPMNID